MTKAEDVCPNPPLMREGLPEHPQLDLCVQLDVLRTFRLQKDSSVLVF